jgi:hypothetical protein
LGFLTVVVGGAYFLLSHEPTFYRQAGLAAGPERASASRAFEVKAFDLINEMQTRAQWQIKVTDQECNSWFAEDFIHSNLAQQLPGNVREPRIAFVPGGIQVGFRYGTSDWNSVVSLEAQVWLAPRETNAVVVKIVHFNAGAMPLTSKILQEELTKFARRNNIKVQWYRQDDHPVVVLRFQHDRRVPSMILKRLDLRQGELYLEGSTPEPEVPPPTLPGGQKPALPKK